MRWLGHLSLMTQVYYTCKILIWKRKGNQLGRSRRRWMGTDRICIEKCMVCGGGLASSGSVTGCCENGNESLGSVNQGIT